MHFKSKKKRMTALFVAMVMVASLMPAMVVSASPDNVLQLVLGNTTYTFNGAAGSLDVAPFSDDGRTMVPFRFIGELMGATVTHTDANAAAGTPLTAHFSLGGTNLDLPMGQAIYVDGDNMGTPAIVDGRALVPVRYVAVMMGAEVDWDGETQTVTIRFSLPTDTFAPPLEDDDDLPPAGDDEDSTPPGDNGEEDDDDEEDEDDDEDDEDDTPAAVASGHVLRHTHGTVWGQIVLTHNFTDDEYTITLAVMHASPAAEFGIDPPDGAAVGFNFLDENDETLETTRADSPANTWQVHSFTFPGAQAVSGLQIAPAYPRVSGATFYIDNVVITNSAGDIVFSNDFESNANGFSVREWSEDSQARVPMP
ncbi:MAG: copper amine oxidase N-terminal domain-containing protein [Defluviitaleaceae bacterium]|nr:copper amine oxidase N-terminal domain-containing protein [Defluviitaleaceae bacterium]